MVVLKEAKVVCWTLSLCLIAVSFYELVRISIDARDKLDPLHFINTKDGQLETRKFGRETQALPLILPVKKVDISFEKGRNSMDWGRQQTRSWSIYQKQGIKKPTRIVTSPKKEDGRFSIRPFKKLDLKSIFKRASMKQAFTGLEQDDNFGHITNQIQTNVQKGIAEAIGGTMQVNAQDLMEGVDISWPADILSTVVCAVFVSTECVGPLPPYTLPFGLP